MIDFPDEVRFFRISPEINLFGGYKQMNFWEAMNDMKKMGMLFLILASMLIPVCASAASEPVESVTVDTKNHTLTVKGTIPEDADKWITIEILKENVAWTKEEANDGQKSLEDYSENDSILDYLEFFGQINVKTQPEYTLTIRNYKRDTEPEIRMRLGKNRFYYYSPGVLREINAVKTSSGLKEIVLNNAFLNNQISQDYELLNPTQTDIFWDMLFDKRNSLDDGFSTFGEVIENAKESVRLTKLKSAADANEIKSVITLCEEYGISESNSYDLYLSTGDFKSGMMSEQQKTRLLADLFAKRAGYDGILKFVNDFLDKTVLYACSGNESKYYVKSILQKSDRLTEENMGDFPSLGNIEKLSVCNAINKTAPYESIADLEEAIDLESSGSSSGGSKKKSGGGGNSGGFAGSISLPENKENADAVSDKAELFADLDGAEWAKEAIYYLKDKNIVAGKGGNIFDPSSYVLREEFSKMLVLANNCYDSTAVTEFDDVDSSAWYCAYVASAQKTGLVKGVGSARFGTGMPITREDMALMLARASGEEFAENTNSGFSDEEQISKYARGAVEYCAEKGIMNGVGNSMFAPKEFVTRAQAAKAVYELVRRK